jgi:hypothetical protein
MPSNEMLLSEIRRLLNYEQLFGEFVRLQGRGDERTALCAFHEESNPSMSVNVVDGLYFCHNPECGARGDFIEFFMKMRDMTFTDAVRELARRVGIDPEAHTSGPVIRRRSDDELIAGYRPPEVVAQAVVANQIDEAIVENAHTRLLATGASLEYLEVKRGLTRETVVEYQLGHDGDRFFIPVRDEGGRCVNIRRYKPQASRAQDKMISWRSGFGQARLYPLKAFEAEGIIYLFEGEMDTLLARQHGLNGITTTGGAGTWRQDWNTLFAGRNVVICYDVDPAGRIGAMHVAGQLLDTAASLKVVILPLSEPVGADFTDFVVGHGHTAADFRRLVEETTPFRREQVPTQAPEVEPTTLHLSQASRSEYYNQPIRMSVMVSGKTMAPYMVPKEVKMTCPAPGTFGFCDQCPLNQNGATYGTMTRDLDYRSNEILQFTDVTDEQLYRRLKGKFQIPGKCPIVKQDVLKALNVERLQIIPEIDRSEEDQPYVTREVFYVGHGLQANRSYTMTGITVPEPKKQLATHIITGVVPAQSNIERFTLTDDVKSRLMLFQPQGDNVSDLWRHIDSVYEDLEKQTRIYQRRDLMLAVDFTFHSALRFALQGEMLVRGWCEALFIGDSRTGKTTIVQRMMDHYGAGEFSTGENTTLAGLVGGLHQIGTSWALQWGRIPLNDRRLLAIDEAGNLPIEQIARMSSMRSSGIAEIVKIHTERTNARTRMIWMTNPRAPRPLSSYSQGVLAVKEMVGAPEDIARFDLVVTAASSDVSLSVVNSRRTLERAEVFTADLCHQRVMFAWSRRAEHIVLTDEANDAILAEATQMGRMYRYATEIPLVEPNEQRVKLARLAVSAATIFYSTDETGEKVVVKPEHVIFAAQFLERMYSKPSLAFDEYARMQTRRYEIENEAEVRVIITHAASAAQALMEQEQLTQRDLQEILGYDDRDEMRKALTTLRESGFLRRVGSSYYVKTSGANAWLRRLLTAHRNGTNGSSNGTNGHREGAVPTLLENVVPDAPGW